MAILPPGHLNRGGISRHPKYKNAWRVQIIINGKRYRKHFSDFVIAETLHRALVRLKEYYYARKTLDFWGLAGEMDVLEKNNYLELKKEDYKDIDPARRQVLIDMYHEINQRLKGKCFPRGSKIGRKPLLGPQEDCRISPVKPKWKEKLKKLGYLKD